SMANDGRDIGLTWCGMLIQTGSVLTAIGQRRGAIVTMSFSRSTKINRMTSLFVNNWPVMSFIQTILTPWLRLVFCGTEFTSTTRVMCVVSGKTFLTKLRMSLGTSSLEWGSSAPAATITNMIQFCRKTTFSCVHSSSQLSGGTM